MCDLDRQVGEVHPGQSAAVTAFGALRGGRGTGEGPRTAGQGAAPLLAHGQVLLHPLLLLLRAGEGRSGQVG